MEISKNTLNTYLYKKLSDDNQVLTRIVIFEKYNRININAGYIYAPYIPIFNTELLYDFNCQVNNIIQSKYATSVINSQFFGSLKL